ncbi:DUF393 domain-containing protein [Leptospira fletcheri]|uniref:DUF393 domain-containing protein n=1 Tax=Leptospira fletcheri TaxID=2484981 RepID=A0A4R9GJ97_9LEPT|nr:DCC1-like thiol-disulfide oxidoreductase family protein [Leptospira fletcheri]TGK13044.1 DUF393 domain-containing protein [Leptospira fletcheri]
MNERIFLYDGDCPFCFRLGNYLKKNCLDTSVQFRSFREFQEQDLRKLHPSLGTEIAQGNVQLIDNGTRYPGFFAVRRLSHSLRGWKWFSLLLYLPFVPLLGMLVMSLLKSLRNSGN